MHNVFSLFIFVVNRKQRSTSACWFNRKRMGDKGGHGSSPGDAAVPPVPGTSRGNVACPSQPGLHQPTRALCGLQVYRGDVRQGGPVRRVLGDATPSAAAAASVAACHCVDELSQAGWQNKDRWQQVSCSGLMSHSSFTGILDIRHASFQFFI